MASQDKPFRHVMRDRILIEMLRAAKTAGSAKGAESWKVLITDSFTLKVISSSCKMPDVTEEGISLVEDLSKKRQPQPFMDGLYFIQPSQQSLSLFKSDMQGKDSKYKRAHVFFSRPLPKEFLQVIKDDPVLRSRIAALREMNLEVLTVDIQGFVTDQPDALPLLFSSEISGREYERTVHEVAARLATVFASLMEFPSVRYKAAKVSSAGAGSPQRMRDMVPSKVAAALWERICKYKAELKDFPQRETCDLLIVDRTVDPVTPVIHDWSYGGMVFDLLPLDGNKYEYEMTGADGKKEKKTVLIDEHDPVWMELRDLFMLEANTKVKELFDEVTKKMKTKENLSGTEMQELVRNMPAMQERKDKVGLHLNILKYVSDKLKAEDLYEVGEMEQGFVFGDKAATYKELSRILSAHKDDMRPNTKLRLLLVYAATNPDKLDAQKLDNWCQLAELTKAQMQAVSNLEYLGVPIGLAKQQSPAPPAEEQAVGSVFNFGVNFGAKIVAKLQSNQGRKPKVTEYELERYYPLLEDILEEMVEGKLSAQDYPAVQGANPMASAPQPQAQAAAPDTPPAAPASASARSTSSSSAASASGSDSGRGASPAAAASARSKPGSVRKKPTRGQSESGSTSASSSGSSSGGSVKPSWALKNSQGSTGSGSGRDKEGGELPHSDSASAHSVRGSSVRGGSSGTLSGSVANLSLRGPGAKSRRLFVFVIGGITRAELKMAHDLSKKLNREVIIGSTSLETQDQFVQKLISLKK